MTSLRHKLWLGFGGLLLVLLAVSLLSAFVLTYYSHIVQQFYRENYDSVRYADGMRRALDQLDLRARQVIFGPGHSSTIDGSAAEKLFQENLTGQLGNITLWAEGEGIITHRLDDLWSQFLALYPQLEKTPAADRQDYYLSRLFPLEQQIWHTAQNISDINMDNLTRENGRAQPALVEARDVVVVLVAAGSILAAVVVWAGGAAVWHSLAALTRSALSASRADRQVKRGSLRRTARRSPTGSRIA